NTCNHKGGPLSEGRLRGEFVMCPWHAWEYSVITGKGPEGYDEEQVPVFAVEERPDGVYVQTPPVMPRKLVKHKPSHLLEEHAKPAGAPPRVLVISTTAMDDVNPRFSTSDALLEHAVDQAKRRGAETRYIKLRDLKFRHCEGNYSKAAHACTWPSLAAVQRPVPVLARARVLVAGVPQHRARAGLRCRAQAEPRVAGDEERHAQRSRLRAARSRGRFLDHRRPAQSGDRQAHGAGRTQGEHPAGAGRDRGADCMSRRLDVARAYEKALFAGNRAETGRYFTDDIVYWVAGAPRIGGEWRGREAVLDALWNREPGLGAADWGSEDLQRDWY